MNYPPAANSWNGRFIGANQQYRIDRPLAAGGMGEVLLATDTRVAQQVVVKLLKDTLVSSPEMIKRFEREVTVCAALQSEHIVKINDYGVTPEGYPFYVMEYLLGQSLRQLLVREQRLSVERSVNIISQVCQGLRLAHQGVTVQKDGSNEYIQVIHRDLKPDNIFLVPTDLGEWVKILDFGVAKIRSESSELTNITNTFRGTFRYAAPEQIENKKNLDARADIYSLGIILYEMLSGAYPFAVNVQVDNISEAAWILAHAYEPPQPLRSQPGCEQLSLQLESLVLKCLHKNPNHRFASVEQLNQALQAVINQPITLNTMSQDEDTIVQVKTLSQLGFSPEDSQSEEETIINPQSVHNQDYLNDAEATIIQPRPVTLSPTLEDAEATIVNPYSLERSPTLEDSEPTIVNPYSLERSPTLEDSEATIVNLYSLLEDSEETIVQPRPSHHSAASDSDEETIVQPHPSPYPHTGQINHQQASDLEDTVYQPRPAFSQSSENTPEETIIQPK
jgi:serine/threonine protein kinase